MQFKPFNEWKKEFNSIRYYNWIPSVTSILKVIKDPEALKQFKQYNQESFDKMMKEKAALGTKLHQEIETVYRDKKLMKLSGFHQRSFLKFYSSVWKKWKPIELEKIITTDNYAWTYDALMEIDWKQYIIDWKSTGQRIYPELLYKYKLQLSAYANAIWVKKWKVVFFYWKMVKYQVVDIENLHDYYQDFEKALAQFKLYYDTYTSWTS